jgi:hypothetical protein
MCFKFLVSLNQFQRWLLTQVHEEQIWPQHKRLILQSLFPILQTFCAAKQFIFSARYVIPYIIWHATYQNKPVTNHQKDSL